VTLTRRSILKGLAAGAATAMLPRGARAQSTTDKTYCIELCLRDQIDFGHVMVAPGLAKATNLRRGENGRACALFYDSNKLIQKPGDVFLTPESATLEPHVDSVAMVELCELTFGPIHGHEAGNPARSPGRGKAGAGRIAMWNGEPGQQSSEGATYSSTPTFSSFHNAWIRTKFPDRTNGIVIKGTQRPFAIYQFGAGLAGAELTRFQSVNELLAAFPNKASTDSNTLKTAAQADAVRDALTKLDRRALTARSTGAALMEDHSTQLSDLRNLLYRGAPKSFSLALTSDEKTYWSSGVPGKYGRTTIDVWEQAAYAFKLVSNDVVQSVVMEVDIGDVHGERTAPQMKQQTGIIVGPLVKLIESLKKAGIYDRTLIIVSTADGGRAPAAGSSGDEGKNGFILAGGMIRGGYYGDIRPGAADGNGQKYVYHAPDVATGAPAATGTEGNDRRLAPAPLWRTMAKALKISDTYASQFPDVKNASPLSWLLR
jgi:hypothetical protein